MAVRIAESTRGGDVLARPPTAVLPGDQVLARPLKLRRKALGDADALSRSKFERCGQAAINRPADKNEITNHPRLQQFRVEISRS
jgi:hypothetical protein